MTSIGNLLSSDFESDVESEHQQPYRAYVVRRSRRWLGKYMEQQLPSLWIQPYLLKGSGTGVWWLFFEILYLLRKWDWIHRASLIFPDLMSTKSSLVGGWALPLWKMMEWKSVGMMTFPTEWKNNPFMFQPTNKIIMVLWIKFIDLTPFFTVLKAMKSPEKALKIGRTHTGWGPQSSSRSVEI